MLTKRSTKASLVHDHASKIVTVHQLSGRMYNLKLDHQEVPWLKINQILRKIENYFEIIEVLWRRRVYGTWQTASEDCIIESIVTTFICLFFTVLSIFCLKPLFFFHPESVCSSSWQTLEATGTVRDGCWAISNPVICNRTKLCRPLLFDTYHGQKDCSV